MRSKIRQIEEQDAELLKLHEKNGDLGLKVQNLEEELKTERADRKVIEEQCSDMIDTTEELEAKNSELKQKLAAARKLPDAAEVYNQFKAKNPKTKFTYKDVVAIVATAQEILEES